MPDSTVKENHERIISALQVNGYKFPYLSDCSEYGPADIRKRVCIRSSASNRNIGRYKNRIGAFTLSYYRRT